MPQDQHVHGHAHDRIARGGTEKRLLGALLLTGGFMVAEVVGGILSGSLALLADAGHMFTDVGALVLAYVGVRLARRPGDPQRTFGYARLEVLAAFTNGIALLALSAWILVEAVIRLFELVQVLSGTMLVVATIGLAVNVASFFILRGGEEANLNVQGALVHVLGDLLGSVAAIVAAVVIRFTGWMPIDPLLSALVALLIIRSGWDITGRSGHILLEGAPEAINRGEIERSLAALPGIAGVHHIHVWSLTSGRPLATMHLRLETRADVRFAISSAKAHLREKFGIDHSTIEIEIGSDRSHRIPHERCHQCVPRKDRELRRRLLLDLAQSRHRSCRVPVILCRSMGGQAGGDRGRPTSSAR